MGFGHGADQVLLVRGIQALPVVSLVEGADILANEYTSRIHGPEKPLNLRNQRIQLYTWGKPKPLPTTGIHKRALGEFRGTYSALVKTMSTALCVRRRRAGHGGMASLT